MKRRNGFVSNSSSSSFVCDVCGTDVSGWDMCLDEAEMYECVNGHCMCEDHITKDIDDLKKEYMIKECNDFLNAYVETKDYDEDEIIKYKGYLKAIEENSLSEGDEERLCSEFRYYLPESGCPICSMEEINDGDFRKYVFKKYEINKDELIEEIKEKYKTYKDFTDSLKPVK